MKNIKLNNGLSDNLFAAHAAANKAMQEIQESKKFTQPTIGADKFNGTLLESKLNNDATFLVKLLQESGCNVAAAMPHLQTLMEATSDLFKEIDMKPRTCSAAIDTQELTESVKFEIYAKNITDEINENYSLPLFEGTLLTDHKDEASLLMKAGISANILEESNTETLLKYALFENEMMKNIKNIMVPKILEERTSNFINTQSEEYFKIFDKNAKTILKTIEESAQEISAIISPSLFTSSTGVVCKEYAGISKALNR
jgi:hypothetical protein